MSASESQPRLQPCANAMYLVHREAARPQRIGIRREPQQLRQLRRPERERGRGRHDVESTRSKERDRARHVHGRCDEDHPRGVSDQRFHPDRLFVRVDGRGVEHDVIVRHAQPLQFPRNEVGLGFQLDPRHDNPS